MNKKKILMVDLETDGVDPEVNSPIQISALCIDPMTLQVVPNTEFNSFCRPESFSEPDYLSGKILETYKFHAENKNTTVEAIVKMVEEAPPLRLVFDQFVDYTRRYHDGMKNKTTFTAPIFAGFNSLNFDEPIIKRLCIQYRYVDSSNKPNIFFWRDSIDVMKLVWPWLEHSGDAPKNMRMDTLRQLFGINTSLANAHDGLQDCKDQAILMAKLLKLNRAFYSKVKWPWLQQG